MNLGMKIRFLTTLIAAITLALMTAQTARADLMDNLLLYMSFDDGLAIDKSCYDHNGDIYGAEPIEGVSGLGMGFVDTEQDYIDIPDVADFAWNNESATFSVWTKVTDNPNYYRVYVSLGDGSAVYPHIQLGKYRSDQWEGRFYMIVHLGGSSYSAACSDLTGPDLVSRFSECWVHVAGVYDASDGTVDLYVNGQLQDDHRGLSTISYDLTTSNDLKLIIGQSHELSSPNGWNNHPLDEIRIYNRALSGEEIKSLANMHKQRLSDIDGSGIVDVADLLTLLSEWGSCP